MRCQDKSRIFVNIPFYCQHGLFFGGFFSSTLTYIFRSFKSCMCNFTDKKDFGVLPHGVPAPHWHRTHTMNDFVRAYAVASQGWRYRDEGLHGACWWVTWLRKTALGFAPRGREGCAISLKNIPAVPTSVARCLWIRPSCGRLPIVRGREGH